MTRAALNARLNALLQTIGVNYLANRPSISPVESALIANGWVRSGVLPVVSYHRTYTYTITRDPARQARAEARGEVSVGQNLYTSRMTEIMNTTVGFDTEDVIGPTDEIEAIALLAIRALPRIKLISIVER